MLPGSNPSWTFSYSHDQWPNYILGLCLCFPFCKIRMSHLQKLNYFYWTPADRRQEESKSPVLPQTARLHLGNTRLTLFSRATSPRTVNSKQRFHYHCSCSGFKDKNCSFKKKKKLWIPWGARKGQWRKGHSSVNRSTCSPCATMGKKDFWGKLRKKNEESTKKL